MTYHEFYRNVCDHVSGLGVVVRTESFVAPDAPDEMAVYISSDAHEVPVAFGGISSLIGVGDASVAARVDMALDALASLVDGTARLNHQQRAAYNRLAKQASKMKPKARILHA